MTTEIATKQPKAAPSRVHYAVLKMYGSKIYRRKVKMLSQMIKNALYPTMAKIPHGMTPRPDKVDNEVMLAWQKANQYRIDSSVVHYFAQAAEFTEHRRGNRGQANNEEAKIANK